MAFSATDIDIMKEMIRTARQTCEYAFFRTQDWLSCTRALRLPCSQPYSRLSIEHIHNRCNKTTAIYRRGCCTSRPTLQYLIAKWQKLHPALAHHTYRFQHFLACQVECPAEMTIPEIVKGHKEQCDQVQRRIQFPLDEADSTSDERIRTQTYWNIHPDEYYHFKLRPVFRALLIVAEDSPITEDKAQAPVWLVRTRDNSGLPEHIDFEGLREYWEGEEEPEAVRLPFDRVIEFVAEVDKREDLNEKPRPHKDPELGDLTDKEKDRMDKVKKEVRSAGPDRVPGWKGAAIRVQRSREIGQAA